MRRDALVRAPGPRLSGAGIEINVEQRARERVGVARSYETADSSVEQLADAAGVSRDDRNAERHRLDERRRNPLHRALAVGVARENDRRKASRSVPFEQSALRQKAGELDQLAQTQERNQIFELLAARADTSERAMNLDAPVAQLRERV